MVFHLLDQLFRTVVITWTFVAHRYTKRTFLMKVGFCHSLWQIKKKYSFKKLKENISNFFNR